LSEQATRFSRVKRSRGRGIEVDSLADFDRRLAAGATVLRGWRVRDVDLAERSAELRDVRVAGALFLGCRFAPGEAEVAEARGAVVVPDLPDVPLDVHIDRLYGPADLYDAASYADSLDARTYAWSQTAHDRESSMAMALHDHAVDEALDVWIHEQRSAGRRLVGLMGGHALERGTPGYRDAARLGRRLGARHVVATGGGPGAMEAANLGGYLAGVADETALEVAIGVLEEVPSFRPSVEAWVRSAFAVRQAFPGGAATLGIPTWFYGHEPPNVLATAIAKYVRNAQREAVLLEVCHAGIVFLPGVGGTVQEVFQDACENYYADESSVASMVLVGRAYWTEELPAWPLLKALARGRAMEPHVHLVDDVDEAAELFEERTP
jgi:predicted Rossmann-fold nucleotide-binding protein